MSYEPLKWWGYLHTNGTVQVKRYFGPRDIEEANESPFVQDVTQPFGATSREDALEVAAHRLRP